jgi:hypothetical protein
MTKYSNTWEAERGRLMDVTQDTLKLSDYEEDDMITVMGATGHRGKKITEALADDRTQSKDGYDVTSQARGLAASVRAAPQRR